ncbi:hypothetical protein IWZ00DRAFT_63593 [Phyllosticta capitalensis]
MSCFYPSSSCLTLMRPISVVFKDPSSIALSNQFFCKWTWPPGGNSCRHFLIGNLTIHVEVFQRRALSPHLPSPDIARVFECCSLPAGSEAEDRRTRKVASGDLQAFAHLAHAQWVEFLLPRIHHHESLEVIVEMSIEANASVKGAGTSKQKLKSARLSAVAQLRFPNFSRSLRLKCTPLRHVFVFDGQSHLQIMCSHITICST